VLELAVLFLAGALHSQDVDAPEVDLGTYLAPEQVLDPERGLLLEEMSTDDGARIVYERPVVVLPPVLVRGETHTSIRRFVLRRDGTREDVGSHYFESEYLGTETLDGDGECLRIRRHTLRMDFSGKQLGEDFVEWYAKDRGVVKMSGERYWKDADGNIVRTESIQ